MKSLLKQIGVLTLILAFVGFMLPHRTYAAPTIINVGHASGGGSASVTKTLQAGDLVIVAGITADANGVTTISDGVNTYTQIGLSAGVRIDVNANAGNLSMWYAQNVSAGSVTITATDPSGSGTTHIQMIEYSGMLTSGVFDQTAQARSSAAPGSTQILTGVTGTRTQADELLVCVGAISPTVTDTFTAGTNFTKQDGGNSFAIQDWTVSSTGTDQCTWTAFSGNQRWGGIIATFKIAATATTPIPAKFSIL